MTDVRLPFPFPSQPRGFPFPIPSSLHFPPSLFLFLPTRIRENGSLSGNWNPVIYGARRGEDSWINVQVCIATASRIVI